MAECDVARTCSAALGLPGLEGRAVAHSILVAVWHIPGKKTPYEDLGAAYFIRLNHEVIRRRCLRELERLGYRVELPRQAA